MNSSMDKAIADFVFAHAKELNRVPADCIWMGDLIADFVYSPEYLLTLKPFSDHELRPEVLAFALLMEKRLRQKDADKSASWKTKPLADLAVNVSIKHSQLASALRFNSPTLSLHAIDLGNYCMMVADVAGALETDEDNGGEGWAALDQPDEARCM